MEIVFMCLEGGTSVPALPSLSSSFILCVIGCLTHILFQPHLPSQIQFYSPNLRCTLSAGYIGPPQHFYLPLPFQYCEIQFKAVDPWIGFAR